MTAVDFSNEFTMDFMAFGSTGFAVEVGSTIIFKGPAVEEGLFLWDDAFADGAFTLTFEG